jgi:hypothetical protein
MQEAAAALEREAGGGALSAEEVALLAQSLQWRTVATGLAQGGGVNQ